LSCFIAFKPLAAAGAVLTSLGSDNVRPSRPDSFLIDITIRLGVSLITSLRICFRF
jgi:hypothetical protein